jgi:hypothetical protein
MYKSVGKGKVRINANSSNTIIHIMANGYKVLDTILQAPYSNTYIFYLIKAKSLKNVNIKSKFDLNYINANQVGLVSIPIATLKKMPALLGEKDLLKALQFTPGIQFGHEGTTELIVRGGSNDQNLVLLDDVPVYNLNHLFGFLSILPTDAVKDIQLYKAGFPAQYGGRLSSVLDIKTKEGSLNKRYG